MTRGQILGRCLRLRCPNCAGAGLLKSWFRLNRKCPACGMETGKEEGFTLGTTSIGYVLALFVILLPLILLAAEGRVSFWVALLAGGLGSFLFPLTLYPLLLCWVVGGYYGSLPGELPANQEREPGLPEADP